VIRLPWHREKETAALSPPTRTGMVHPAKNENLKNVFEIMRTNLSLPREIVDLASGGGERVFDRHLNMLVPFVVGRRVIDYDVFVWGNCKPDVDMEVAALTVFVAGCYHCYAASNDMAICFSSRSTSRSIAARAASDGSDPSKVTCSGICMTIFR
jgi:hypothetical protein